MTTFSANNRKAAKLTGEQVLSIRQKYALPGRQYTQDRLAREYQVSVNTIRNIVNGVTWQSLPLITSQAEEATAAKLSELRARAMLDAGLMETGPASSASEETVEVPEKLKPKKPNPYT
jgi:hypothetical protein